jgi:hypothetical protein
MLSETKEVGKPGACRAGAWHSERFLIGWCGSGVPHLFIAVIVKCTLSAGTHAATPEAGFACLAFARRRRSRDGYIATLRLYFAHIFPQTS